MQKKSFVKYWLPVYLYSGLIFIFSSLSFPSTGLDFEVPLTNLIHVIEYAILGFLLFRALLNSNYNFSKINLVIFCIGISTIYGILIEIHQYFIPTRSPEIKDILFNFLGSGLGVIFLYIQGA